jgi:hypothetical protein
VKLLGGTTGAHKLQHLHLQAWRGEDKTGWSSLLVEKPERRKKERLPSTALPGLYSVVSSFTYPTVKIACLMRSLELISPVSSS